MYYRWKNELISESKDLEETEVKTEATTEAEKNADNFKLRDVVSDREQEVSNEGTDYYYQHKVGIWSYNIRIYKFINNRFVINIKYF